MTFLIGTRIKLVKFTERFIVPKYIDWINNQDINKYMFTGRIPISKEDVGNRNDFQNIMFAIMSNIHLDSGDKLWEDDNFSEYIGTISLNRIDWINRKGEIGYMVGEKTHWGLGVATEAVKLVSDYGLHRLNLNKVEAGVVDGNIGSIKVLEKNGFKECGIVPEDYWSDGKYNDVHRFYKLQGW